MASVEIIIVAAGSGLRFGAPLPKQFCDLSGRPVLMHTIDSMRRALPEAGILLVLSPDMEEYWHGLCTRHKFVSPRIVHGGSTRWESVRNAIVRTSPDTSVILVHDGVRPLADARLINATLSPLDESSIDGVIPAVAATDSFRRINPDGTSQAIDRSALRAVQTPQAFRADRLRLAYQQPYSTLFTDDASVMEAAGFRAIVLSEGSYDNIKITNPGDIAIAELILDR